MALTDPIIVPGGTPEDVIVALQGALAQAAAAEQAARMQAAAAISAAWTQGWFTVAAGIAALGAAIIYGYFQMQAARRQVQLAEAQHAARVSAFRVLAKAVLDDLRDEVSVLLDEARERLEEWTEFGGGRYPIPVLPIRDVPDFSEARWEDHALLGNGAPKAIHDVHVALQAYNRFERAVGGDGLRCDDFPANDVATFGDLEQGADEDARAPQENVVQSNVTHLAALDAAIRHLQRMLSGD